MIKLTKEKNHLICDKDAEYLIFDTHLKELIIEVKDNVNIIINDYRNIKNEETKILFIMNNNSSLLYNQSFINEEEYNLDIKTEYKGTNSKITYNIHGINAGGKTHALLDGIMGTKEKNYLLENIKLINIRGGTGTIIPNILIGVSDIVADHKATIGNINKKELEYLMSKGLSKEASEILILKGFLINIFENKDLQTKVKENINLR